MQYTFEIFPVNIPDGLHDFDGIQVLFAKPGWQWIIVVKDQLDARVLAMGDDKGYTTRDAALVDLLKEARELT